ncbi:MAG: hypothetical protein KAR64_06055 [Thermoplasmatales archaeon]|nr:hypothetical protein [Thermoplasmatales archaeon]
MELNLNQEMKQVLSALLLVLLPLIVLGLGVIFGVKNAGYYILTMIWLGVGVIFFSAIY